MTPLGALSRLFRPESAAAPLTDRFSCEGKRVRVAVIAGEVRLHPTDGAVVEVRIERTGADADHLTVTQARDTEGTVITVGAAGSELVYPPLGAHGSCIVPVNAAGALARTQSETVQHITVRGAGTGSRAHAVVDIAVPRGAFVQMLLGAGICRVDECDALLHLLSGGAEVRATNARGALEIRGATGDAKIRSFQGSLEVHTASGDISLYDTETDRLVATSDEGAIRGALLRSAALVVHADQGSLSLQQVRASDVALTANAGDMDVAVTSDVGRMSLRAKLGTIRLALPELVNATITAHSPFGNVQSDLTLDGQHETHTGLTGRLGSGAGQIYLETTAGDVVLERVASDD